MRQKRTVSRVSEHAIEKYVSEKKRLDPSFVPRDPEKEIRRMFAQARKERWAPGLVLRVIKNRFEEASYYRYGNWRFVICGDVMVTIERNVFSKPRLVSSAKKRKRKWKKKNTK